MPERDEVLPAVCCWSWPPPPALFSDSATRRYRTKKFLSEGTNRIFFVDTATGDPPKTPCGPDEDDD